ncbi:hypothetical protein KIH74_29725 [Kineosporia sp. J2-2]|uniref:Major facilitator superfamily (MFS) profile domain-containing protein n=1 Tax=Kineosporia corallincola TaxID=2835133 RepID=A0ABS5TPX3_9ACTN|nr:hypothetical protein [Kineosporia corallincola]MBT0773160.1 hypothetical protein [Kineosporia corallincola]
MPATTALLLLDAVPARRTGTASGVFSASRQVGGALAVAVFGALLATPAGFGHGLRVGLVLAAVISCLAAGVTALLSPRVGPGRSDGCQPLSGFLRGDRTVTGQLYKRMVSLRTCPLSKRVNRSFSSIDPKTPKRLDSRPRGSWNSPVYPGSKVLEEIGRIAVAASRLDAAMGRLWSHLDRSLDPSNCQRASASVQAKEVRKAAEVRLVGTMRDEVLGAADKARSASGRRNALMHQEWLIRGDHVMRPVSDLRRIPAEEMESYLEDWAREARDAERWQIADGRSQAIGTAQTLGELTAVEKDLRDATDHITRLTFAVASSRETGSPPGYQHPQRTSRPGQADARRRMPDRRWRRPGPHIHVTAGRGGQIEQFLAAIDDGLPKPARDLGMIPRCVMRVCGLPSIRLPLFRETVRMLLPPCGDQRRQRAHCRVVLGLRHRLQVYLVHSQLPSYFTHGGNVDTAAHHPEPLPPASAPHVLRPFPQRDAA